MEILREKSETRFVPMDEVQVWRTQDTMRFLSEMWIPSLT
jgi:hypothetical protein